MLESFANHDPHSCLSWVAQSVVAPHRDECAVDLNYEGGAVHAVNARQAPHLVRSEERIRAEVAEEASSICKMSMELHERDTVIGGDGAYECTGAIAEGNRVCPVCLRSGLRIHTPDLAGIASRSVGSFVRDLEVFGPDPDRGLAEIGTTFPAGEDLGP